MADKKQAVSVRRRSVFRPIAAGVAGVVSLCFAARPASAEVAGVNPETYYQIVYEVSEQEAKTISAARVAGVLKIGSREFLIIEPQGLPGIVSGYLDLEHVRSILPPTYFQ